MPTIRRHVTVEPDAMAVTVLSRDHAGEAFWAAGLTGDDTLHLPEVGIEIPVAMIYDRRAQARTSSLSVSTASRSARTAARRAGVTFAAPLDRAAS